MPPIFARRALLGAGIASAAGAAFAQAPGPISAPPPPAPPPPPPRFFAAALRYSGDRAGAGLIAMRNGVILAEQYSNGGAPAAMNPIGEAAHAYAGALAALLARERLLNLDEPVALTLGGWGADPLKSPATVRHLLSMTSGLSPVENGGFDVARAQLTPSIAAPGAQFVQNRAGLLLFSEIAKRKLAAAARPDADPARYLESKLLAAIGALPIRWARSSDGLPRFDDGAAVTARAWAAFGEFLRRDGVWRARMIVSARALEACFEGSAASGHRFGLGFWLAGVKGMPAPANFVAPLGMDIWNADPAFPSDLAIAAGDGGQRLYVIPSRRVVIARQASAATGAPLWSDQAFLRLALSEI